VKSAIIQIDATPFRQWYEAHVRLSVVTLYTPSPLAVKYAQPVTKKGKAQAPAADAAEPVKLSNHAQRNLDEKKKGSSRGLLKADLYTHVYMQRPKLTLCWNLSSLLAVSTPRSPADLGSQDAQTVTCLRARSSRYVLAPHNS
jgi:hypothetical protein